MSRTDMQSKFGSVAPVDLLQRSIFILQSNNPYGTSQCGVFQMFHIWGFLMLTGTIRSDPTIDDGCHDDPMVDLLPKRDRVPYVSFDKRFDSLMLCCPHQRPWINDQVFRSLRCTLERNKKR